MVSLMTLETSLRQILRPRSMCVTACVISLLTLNHNIYSIGHASLLQSTVYAKTNLSVEITSVTCMSNYLVDLVTLIKFEDALPCLENMSDCRMYKIKYKLC